jgi:hypothetical protein
VVAALLGDQRQANAGVAAGRLDDGATGFQFARLLRRGDHLDGDPVLDRSPRVHILDLGEHQRRDVPGDRPELDQWGVADQVDDGVGVAHG